MSIIEEAHRCLKCKKPQCSQFCPVDTPIPKVMELFLNNEIKKAGEILFFNNPLSSICAIVCPHERNCLGHCVLGKKDTPVMFFEVEQYVSSLYIDTFHPPVIEKNNIKVAVVGAGPAGITMSILLSLRGFNVTLIEARDQIGGVLRFGIPAFRLPKNRIDVYDNVLYSLGVHFKPNTFIGSNVLIDDMFIDGYKAIFLAVGTSKPNKLGLLGETLGNVHYAIDYLRSPSAYHLGRRVAVIGAGNVALDAARMAVRYIGDGEVTIINNRSEADMTGNIHEFEMAKIDGIKFMHQLETIRVTEKGPICARVEVTTDEDGKRNYEEIMTDTQLIPADTVIIAIGQGPQGAAISDAKVKKTTRGLYEVDENGRTTRDGVFAAGDVVTGSRTVCEAVAYAKKVANVIEKYCLQ